MAKAKRVDEEAVRAAGPAISRAVDAQLAAMRRAAEDEAEEGPEGAWGEDYGPDDPAEPEWVFPHEADAAACAISRVLGTTRAVWLEYEHYADWPPVSRWRIETDEGGTRMKDMVRLS